MPRKRKTATGAPAQPVQVAAGGAYGTRTMLEQQQQAAPITAQSATPGQGAPVTPVDAAQVALDHPAPRGIPLSAPTNYPGEPLTAGIDFGPGPGANPLGITAQLPNGTQSVAGLLAALTSTNPSPELQQLADYVNSGRG